MISECFPPVLDTEGMGGNGQELAQSLLERI